MSSHGLPRLVCSASDLYQDHSLSSKHYKKRDVGAPYVPQNGYEVASPYSPTFTVTDSDFSSQDLDSSGYFSAISSREFWDIEQRPDPYGIVRSAFELRDVKSKRKILTNGSLKPSCNNSTTSSLNNSVGELKELKVHQSKQRAIERQPIQPIECTFRPIREPQTPEPMYPDPENEMDSSATQEAHKSHKRGNMEATMLSSHTPHPYYMEKNGNHSEHSTSDSGYSSQSQASKDYSPHGTQKDCKSNQNNYKLSNQKHTKSSTHSDASCISNSNSQVNKQPKRTTDKQAKTVSPQQPRYMDYGANKSNLEGRNNKEPIEGASSNYQNNVTSSSRDIYEISRMVGSAKELSQRHQRKVSQSGRADLSLPDYIARQSNDDTDLSNVIGSAKDLIDNAAKAHIRRQYRRRMDAREEDGPVVLIRSNENFQKYFRDYLLPVSVKEGQPTDWDYFIAKYYPKESSTDPEEVFASNPCQSCPEFQQYGVSNPKPAPPVVTLPPGALKIKTVDLPRAPPAAKVTTEDVCVAPSVLREPESPKPSSYMPLSIAVCLLCSVFAIFTVILSVRTQRALRRGDTRKSRKLSHLTFWCNIGLAVFGAFTYLIVIVVVYVVIHHKGVSISLV